MNQLLITVDPGRSGGVAVRYPDGRVNAWAMPDTDVDTLDLLCDIISSARRERWRLQAGIEKVSGYIGGKGQPGSAMFRFGESYGFVVGVMMALEVPLYLIRPQQWQRALQLGSVADHGSKPRWKRHLRAEAARRFPHLRPTLATADALLLLEHLAQLSAHQDFGSKAERGRVTDGTSSKPGSQSQTTQVEP